jgi:hypothetical protein
MFNQQEEQYLKELIERHVLPLQRELKEILRKEVKQQIKKIKAHDNVIYDCLHNQFCDQQTIDMKCKRKSDCNFKLQSDLYTNIKNQKNI